MVTIGTLSWKVQVEEAADAKQQAEEVADSVEDAKQAMEGADEESSGLRDKLGGLSEVQQAVGKGFDKMNAKAGFFGTALSFVAGVIMTVIGSLLSLKALIVGGVLAAVVALAVAWKENIGDIQGRVGGFVEFMQEQFVALEETVLKIWNNFVEGFKAGGGDIEDLKTIFIGVLNGLEIGLQAFWNTVQPIWSGFSGIIVAAAKPIGRAIGMVIDWIARMEEQFGVITKIISWVTALVAVFATAWAIVQVVTAIIGIVLSFVSAMGTVMSVVATAISVFMNLYGILAIVIKIAASLIAALNPITLVILAIIGVVVALYAAWETNFLGIRDIVGDAVSYMRDKFEGFVDWLSEVPGRIAGFFDGMGDSMASGVKSAFNSALPDEVGLPSVEVAGKTFGGGSLDLPSLNTGGLIKDSGIAEVHEGEAVIPADITREAGLDGSGSSGEDMTKIEVNVGGVEIGDQQLDIRNMSRQELRQLANQIARVLGDEVRGTIS